MVTRRPTPSKSLSRTSQIKKIQKKRKKRFYLSLGVIASSVLLVVLFFRVPFFYVRTVTVEGIQAELANTIAKEINNNITGNTLLVLPKKNIFLISKKSISKLIRDKFSNIENISISKKSFSELSLSLTEYIPEMIFCDTETPFSDCYFVSTNGTIFEKSPKFSGKVYFTVYDTSRTEPIMLGQRVFDDALFTKIVTLKKELEVFDLKAIAFSKGTEDQIYILKKDSSSAPLKIKFKLEQSVESIISNIISALKSETLRKSKENGFTNLEYIDVRFNNKVFYKIRE